MRFAIPVIDGKLTMHFGHSQFFMVIETDDDGLIIKEEQLTPPAHQPGVLPDWLAKEQNIDVVLVAGIGGGAIDIFNKLGVQVITGCDEKSAQELVADYYAKNLESGGNACNH
ncbi:MAG: NifB/NifX family molybdenum-iron cluster-binding protein [Psychromonas sp.]